MCIDKIRMEKNWTKNLISSFFGGEEGIFWNAAMLDWNALTLIKPISWPRVFTVKCMKKVFFRSWF